MNAPARALIAGLFTFALATSVPELVRAETTVNGKKVSKGKKAKIYDEEDMKKDDEESYKNVIVDLLKNQEKLTGISKLDIKINQKAKYPYTKAYNENQEKISAINREYYAFKEIKTLNDSVKTLGKPEVEVDLSAAYPYSAAYKKHSAYIEGVQIEISYKDQVAGMLKTLESHGKPVSAKLSLNENQAYQNYFKAILKEHPGADEYAAAAAEKTKANMSCAETWQGLMAKLDKQVSASQQCEAESELSAENFLGSIAKALKAAAGSETEDEVRERETTTLKVFGSELNSAEAFKYRPGFKDCGLSMAELVAIVGYTGSYFSTLNSALRSGADGEHKAVIDTLNSGLKKIASHKGIVVRRVSDLGKDLELLKPGATVQFKAFTSTTTRAEFASGTPFKFSIETCSGRYIAPISKYKGEEEVLLPSGAKLKVVSRKDGKDGYLAEFELKEICEE